MSWKRSLTKWFNKFQRNEYIFFILFLVTCLFLYLKFASRHKESFGIPKKLIYFHMLTCSHCQMFNPEWDMFSDQYSGDLVLSKIEINEAGNMLDRYKVEGFPTILLIDEHDNTKKFNQNRNVAGLEAFVNNI